MLFIILLILLTGNLIYAQQSNTSDIIKIDDDLQLLHLADSIYVHISWYNSNEFGRFPSNGMLLIKKGQALMIDTPMDNKTTETLYNFVHDSMHAEITKFIAGHYHDDCIGGLEFLHSKGVESIANSMTIAICKEQNLPVPKKSFTDSLKFKFNGEPVKCCYFGAGHSVDNITVWLPWKKILFAGCMIKVKNAKRLGNLKDADINEWDTSLVNLLKTYKNIKTVIPGHGSVGDTELITHTIDLVKIEKNK